MNKIFQLVITTLALLFFNSNVYSQAGTLDNTFDDDGIVTYNLSDGYHETAWDMALFADTSIMLCGTINAGSFSVTDGFLLKLNPDGSVDSTWGTNGFITYSYGTQTYAYDMEVLQNGAILVAGTAYTSWTEADFFVAKFNQDGTPDYGFGVDGVFKSSYSSGEDIGKCMTIQDDGKIVMGGSTALGSYSQLLFLRVNSDGTTDNSFGTDGYTEINSSVENEVINSIGLLSSGTIVGAGNAYYSDPYYDNLLIIVKLNSNGITMSGFGTEGVMLPSWASNTSSANKIEIENDSLYITGYYEGVDNDLFLAKHDSAGIADQAFGNFGVSMFDENIIDNGFDIYLSGDEKIYVCGNTGMAGPGASKDYLLIRYSPDGSLDASFNTTGFITTTIRADSDAPFAVDLQVDGKIVLGGMSSGISTSGNNDVAITRYLNDYIPFSAGFSAGETIVCESSTVNFTDQTYGNPISWEWYFEGGYPSSSNIQNPTVTYNTAGDYDVQLIVSDGSNYDTLIKQDYISVITIPAQANTPIGSDSICSGTTLDYTTTVVQYADSYEWSVSPSDAGTISGVDTVGTFVSSSAYSGMFTIQVRAENICGSGAWSPDFQGNIMLSPQIFQLTGDGAYCQGSNGVELILDGSEAGFDYELYRDDASTGIIEAGTGAAISFGYQLDEGIYTAVAYSSTCTEDMTGEIWVHMVDIPGQAATPQGLETVCNDTVTQYLTTGATDADTLIWSLDPASAGILYPNNQEVTVEWSLDFSGVAYLSVYGENTCGAGDPSEELEIEVNATPEPVISGDAITCRFFQGVIYYTEENTDHTYLWEVEGGTISSGAGTYEIGVDWGEAGTGWVRVTEESPEGCIRTTENYIVTIDECVGIEEDEAGELKAYPVPADDKLNIELNADIEGLINLYVFDVTGRIMIRESGFSAGEKIMINTESLQKGLFTLSVIDESGKVWRNSFLKN